ncbi:hypothetical protein M9458_028655, partial [Cirrhinus mrigala]
LPPGQTASPTFPWTNPAGEGLKQLAVPPLIRQLHPLHRGTFFGRSAQSKSAW